MPELRGKRRGIPLALVSASLMGLTPIFGKQAITAGLQPLLVVALRTFAATALLLLIILVFRRRYLSIYPLGLAGCLAAGALNGAGSLFFYAALARVDAILGQLVFALYPVYVALLLYLDGQRPSRLTLLRLGLCFPSIFLLAAPREFAVDRVGVAEMLMAGLCYALHIPINERVLYEVPAPTVTFYTLAAMTGVVVPAGLLLSQPTWQMPMGSWLPLIGLTAVTFLSRLTLFAGVKSIGGMQTSLLGLTELLVTMVFGILWLQEGLRPAQWLGAALLATVLTLALADRRPAAERAGRGWLYWLRPPIPEVSIRPMEIPRITPAMDEPNGTSSSTPSP